MNTRDKLAKYAMGSLLRIQGNSPAFEELEKFSYRIADAIIDTRELAPVIPLFTSKVDTDASDYAECLAATAADLGAALLDQEEALQRSVSNLRPEVLAFAFAMEAELRKNDHKGGWSLMTPGELLDRLRDKTKELAAFGGLLMGCQLRKMERPHDPTHRASVAPKVLSECADIANFAMMIADNCAGLDPYKK